MKYDKKTVYMIIDKWIEEQRLAEYETSTVTSYKHSILSFINWINNDSFTINKDLLISYKDYLKDNYSVNTCNKYITIVNKFLRYIMSEEEWKIIKIKKLKMQQKTSLDEPIWEQEHKRMLRWAKQLEMNDMYLIIKIFAFTGIRVVELTKFTVENINKNYIKVFNKGKERTIILRNDLLREIKKYIKDNKITTGYIFKSPVKEAKMLNLSTIWRRLKTIARRAKINPDKIHPHAWRHLFAKAFMKIPGNSLDELADILGHSKLETTRIYTMTSNKEKKSKMEQIKY